MKPPPRSCAGSPLVAAQGLGGARRATPRLQARAVALARKLAIVLHRMWQDGTEFRWSREVAAA